MLFFNNEIDIRSERPYTINKWHALQMIRIILDMSDTIRLAC
jgi:hypothetical protein